MARLTILLILILTTQCGGQATPIAQVIRGVEVRVIKFTDGDTIKVRFADGGERDVRYIGIDTPETTRGKHECYGDEATKANRSLIMPSASTVAPSVWLEKDVSEDDGNARLLRYVYLPDGRMVNEVLVEMGYAQAKEYKPDNKYQERLLRAQQRAYDNRLGMWLACAITPVPTIKPKPDPTSTPVLTPGCDIKGNINGNERIYHMPGDQSYDQVKIDTEKGEKWFCSEDDAIASGWRKRK